MASAPAIQTFGAFTALEFAVFIASATRLYPNLIRQPDHSGSVLKLRRMSL
jgi:hypothetical protein